MLVTEGKGLYSGGPGPSRGGDSSSGRGEFVRLESCSNCLIVLGSAPDAIYIPVPILDMSSHHTQRW